MLKLTNSFYRFLLFAFDKGDKANVRIYSYLNCKGQVCSVGCATSIVIARLRSTATLYKQHGQGKKRPKIYIPPLKLDDSDRCKQMSDSLQPTTKHVSCGGTFYISAIDKKPFDEWRRHGVSTTADHDVPNSVPVPPNFREWESVGRTDTPTHGNAVKLRVLSYNVLAQYLLECHPYLYTECISNNLKWDVRASRLYDEITSYEPDIFCLQEVQASHLSSFYSKFERNGYFGIFKQKTGHRKDGCAIYFRKSLFELKDHVTVEFYQPELPILNRDNIGMMVKLIPRQLPSCPIVVATTHLLYNPKRTDVRLAQMQVFLAEIDRFAYYDNRKGSGHCPIILTGDFNSTPDSAVIKLLDTGQVSTMPFRDSSDWQRIGVTDNCQHLSVYLNRQKGRATNFSDTNIYNSDYSISRTATSSSHRPALDSFSGLFNSGVVGHGLSLKSVYDKFRHHDGCEATTFQEYWTTVDYIYFSCCSSLKLVERLRLPTAKECEVLGCLPNSVYGSDHLALAATFELMPSQKSTL